VNAGRGTEPVGDKGVKTTAAGKGPLIAHNVYFSLKDNSSAAKEKLVRVQEVPDEAPGEVFFAAGVLVKDLDRPVNDRILTWRCLFAAPRPDTGREPCDPRRRCAAPRQNRGR